MPSRPSRLTDLSHPDAVHVINQLFAEYTKRIDDIQKLASTKRLGSVSTLVFGTVAANSSVEATVNLVGASTNLVAHANPIVSLPTNLTWNAYTKGAGKVVVRVTNPTGSPVAVPTQKWNILVS